MEYLLVQNCPTFIKKVFCLLDTNMLDALIDRKWASLGLTLDKALLFAYKYVYSI